MVEKFNIFSSDIAQSAKLNSKHQQRAFSFFTTMGKTADLSGGLSLTVSTRRVRLRSAERADCSQSSVSKNINGKATERKSVVGKGAQQKWITADFGQEKQIPRCGRDSQAADWGWSQSIQSHHDRHVQETGYKCLKSCCKITPKRPTTSEASYLSRERTGPLLSGPKSSFHMNVHFHRIHRIKVAWSPVWSFHSQWWFEWHASAGVCPLCGIQNQCSHLPGDFGELHASSCWRAFQRCRSCLPVGPGISSHCQNHTLQGNTGLPTQQIWTLLWRVVKRSVGEFQTDCLHVMLRRYSISSTESHNQVMTEHTFQSLDISEIINPF